MDRVCPLLGLAGDRRTAVDGVDGAHRCHAEEVPAPLDQRVQAQLCLTAAHVRCERYVAHTARVRSARPAAVFGDGLVSTRMLVAPEPVWRGIAGRARRAPRGPVIAGTLAVAAIAVGGVAVTSAALDGRLDFALATPTDPPSARRAASDAGTPLPSPDRTAVPSPAPSASAPPQSAAAATAAAATPEPTLAATAAPEPPPPATPVPPVAPPQETYAVQQGDTLALIAQQFGTTVEALQAANNIDNPDEIVIGQVLVLP